jgi:hypothetical protein
MRGGGAVEARVKMRILNVPKGTFLLLRRGRTRSKAMPESLDGQDIAE